MEYSFRYLLWNENTCKTHKKQVFQNKYSNLKSENFDFLFLKMSSKLLHSLTVVEKLLFLNKCKYDFIQTYYINKVINFDSVIF
jgi:hypothetical protein